MTSQDTLLKLCMITLTAMILGMVVIGGITRLTGSGLSIVEWKPIVGILPPISLEQWMLEFSKYKQSPEFLKINFGMTLPEFQSIYWLEYIHRLWGRLLGIVLLVPTILIMVRKEQRKLWPLVVMLWGLGAAQGIMGWLMVKSGLNLDPHVSPYRLAAHLLLGFAVFGVALWMTLSLFAPSRHCNEIAASGLRPPRNDVLVMRQLTILGIILVLCTAFLGALVAGLKAGLVYNTFPYMGETIIPREFLTQSPWWLDPLENPVSVQFLHRCFAIFTVLYCISLWFYQNRVKLPTLLRSTFTCILGIAIVQFALGLATLLLVVPILLATLHQAFAFVLFGSLLTAVFLLKPLQTSQSS